MFKDIFTVISVLITTLFIFHQLYFLLLEKMNRVLRNIFFGIGLGIIAFILFSFPIYINDFRLTFFPYGIIIAAVFGGFLSSITSSILMVILIRNSIISSGEDPFGYISLIIFIGIICGILGKFIRNPFLKWTLIYLVTNVVYFYILITIPLTDININLTLILFTIGGLFVHLFVKYLNYSYETSRKLQQLSMLDPLTGIYNKRVFKMKLDKYIYKYRKDSNDNLLHLIIFDIDYFKKINDTYGHPAGDRVLKELAEILTHNFKSKGISARIGGEEFAVILPNTDLETAGRMANDFRILIKDHFANNQLEPRNVSISLGVSGLGKTIENTDDLIESADQALYKAKETGRDRVVINYEYNKVK